MYIMIKTIPTKELQDRRIRKAEEHVKEQQLIGLKTIGLMYSKNYVKSIIKWIILERRYINEYILFT